MKLRFFVLLSIMVLGCYGLAGAQSLSLDHTDGLLDADHLDTGVPVTFYIRLTGDGDTHGGITNGFRVYSDDGAVWNPLVGDTTGTLGKAQFDGGFFISHFSATGANADTVGFGAFRFFNTGLPVGFDDVVYTLDIGSLAEGDIGKTICLDSTFTPPSGVWKWAGPDVYPGWSGPHCFTVGPPAECAVTVTAPAGGETWEVGSSQIINWTTSDCADCNNVDISYSIDGGAWVWYTTAINDGEAFFTVPDAPSSNVVVRVCCSGTSDCGESGVFTIEAPAVPEIVSVAPNTAAQCDEGLVVTITGANTDWQSVQGSDVVYLQHSSGAPIIMGTNVSVLSSTSVQATFGFAYNVTTGLYDVTVDASPSGPVTLTDGFTVNAATASNIIVSPAELNFDAEVCDPDLDDQSFTITSEICRHNFNLSVDVGWVGVSVMGGTTPAEVIVSVDTTGLGTGTHIGTITVTAPNALNSPQEITVTLVVPDSPAPGGEELTAHLLASATGGASDDLTFFGLADNATDCYDAGIDEFEPPAPPGDFVRTFFRHVEWGQIQSEFNSDIRSPFSTLCKDFVLTVQTNVAENITLSLPEVANPGCYKISLLSADGSAVLVDNFEADSFTFMGSATHVFMIRVCAGGGGTAPSITCPDAAIDKFICGQGQVCVNLPVTNYESVVSTGGATWADGSLCFTATEPGLYVFDVTASNACGDAVCHVEVNVSIGSVPTIDCPQTELAAERCGPGEVCVPLAITGAVTVTVEGATWVDGQLCFDAPTSDGYGFHIIATNDCGEVTCDVMVNVTINDVPAIACPPEPIHVTQDAGDLTCIEIITTGADNITLDGGDWNVSYTNDQFCFDASELGTFSAIITATNECGETTCEVVVIVEDCPLPVVDCPSEALNYELCELAMISFPLVVTGAVDVQVDGGAWADDVFSLMPPYFGTFDITLTATNECGPVVCVFTVNVTEIPAVAIECPAEAFYLTHCAPEEICVDLPIINADEVLVGGGATWVDGQLCFTAEPGTDYIFTVTASNECGEAICVVEFIVDAFDDPVACFTADPTEGTVPLEVTFTDCSYYDGEEGSLVYLWDFGDGMTSTETSPMHIFETIGCFDVSLTVTDACGRQNMTMQTICVLDDQIVTPTDRWINIYCADPMLEGVPLNPGDFITAYDPDGILCGMGQVQPDGSYGMILIYADDIYTADIDEGAEPGDLITLKINGVPVATDLALFWTENGAVFMVCGFTAESCLTFDLDAGWHLISWNVAYTGAVNEAIADFAECVDVVLGFDRGGLTYDPMLPEFSTLNSIDYYHGYWLRLSCPVTFDVCGGIISPNDAIQVYSGWNLVSYWPQDVLPVEDGFASLLATDNLLVAYGFDGAAADYIPGDPLHQSLTDLYPGFGYWVKVINDDMLTYPGYMPPPTAPRVDNQRSLAASTGVTPSRNWMSVYGANLEVDGYPVRSGATVEVFTEDGVLCGSGMYNDGILKFTSIYGYDAENDSYPKDGDQLNIRINGERVASDLTYNGSGARVALASLSAAALLPDAYSMAQNYPNPFNPSTTISFNLPSAGNVELTVFNVLGQKVATILNGHLEAGTHEAEWNGTDESGSTVGSGIYFYRITTSDFDQTKKMILMK